VISSCGWLRNQTHRQTRCLQLDFRYRRIDLAEVMRGKLSGSSHANVGLGNYARFLKTEAPDEWA
jgi:hypothetical protein